MKKRVIKKKGASLIVVLMVTAVVATVVTTMLGMITTSYKARNIESKSLQNMYEADSSLDVVYNIINRTSRAAILRAIDDVANEKNEVIQNETFKKNFLKYIVNGVDPRNANSNLEYSITNWSFPIYNSDVVSYEQIDHDEESAKLEIKDSISLGAEVTGEEQINVRVHSTFKTSDSNSENEKTLEANFVITAPEYKEIQIEKSVDININPVYAGKVITVDGDLEATGTVDFYGDIWAKGTKEGLSKNNKYTGGIIFNDATVNMAANIYTSNTLKVNNKSNVSVQGDIYSANTYITEDTRKASGSSTSLKVTSNAENQGGKLVTFNDLVLNATKGDVYLTTYFGINDINNSSLVSNDSTVNLAENKSSSIIVNNLESSLNIAGDAYIRGVAYLDNNISEEYKTGESVAVKGNYVAYTDPQGKSNVVMKYYSPLQLIEYLNGNEFGLEEKKDYFIKYYENKSASTASGINLGGNVYSAGAIVKNSGNKTVAEGSNTNLTERQIETNVNVEKNNFATNVVSMGDLFDIGNGTASSLYTSWVKNGILSNSFGRTVDGQVNFDNIKNNEDVNEFFGKLILNKDKNKKIVISAGKITVGSADINFSTNEMRALIITNGDVEVDSSNGAVDFTGNIISSKNVTINGTKDNIKLTYDEEVTTKIYASNKEYLDTILEKFSDKVVNVSLVDALSGAISDYDENEYLRKGQWKIIK